MGLIDTDALIKDLSYLYTKNHIPIDMKAKEVLTTVMQQPTAYDVDKVVEQLKTDSLVKLYGSGNSDNYLIPVKRAIEIVKAGGIDEHRYLFKAKRLDNGEWIVGYLYRLSENNPPFIMFRKYGESYEVDEYTICQCTGLKDKNGKLIWENDIVDGHIKRGAAFLNCLVLWNESKARFDVRAKGCNFPMTLDEVTDDISVGGLDYEVVGNQFDNPELLESEE